MTGKRHLHTSTEPAHHIPNMPHAKPVPCHPFVSSFSTGPYDDNIVGPRADKLSLAAILETGRAFPDLETRRSHGVERPGG